MKINLLPISLIISLIGIFLLLLISAVYQPKLTKIEQINNKLLDQPVKIQGTIFKIRNFKDSEFQIISIKDKTGEIDITTNKILNLTNNQTLTIFGKITQYNNTLQIQANKITSN